MAHKIEILRGATTYVLNDPSDLSNPFSLEDGAGLGGASVRNIEERGPYQDGASHLTSRLEPGVSTWRIFVKGATAAALDGHRDTLNKMFKPIEGVPIIVKYTRDDGAIRYQENQRIGPLEIPLVKEHFPGNLHKAVVQLRAADPTWYNPTQQTAGFTPPAGEWWLGLATIGSANAMTHVEAPTQGQLWTHSGSVANGSAWTVAFRSTYPTLTVFPWRHAFSAIIPATGQQTNLRAYAEGTPGLNVIVTSGTVGDFEDGLAAGTHNYFMIMRGTAMDFYRDTTLVDSYAGTTQGLSGTAAGTARWRSEYTGSATTYWDVALPYAAVYNIALNPTQQTSLNAALDAAGSGGSAYSAPVVYLGDVDSRPVITIVGPIADPVITNETTGDVLNFTGGTLGTADIWVIDTRYGRKSALLGTTSIANYLSTDSDLATFRLVPDPIAGGGTNIITVDSTDAGTAAVVTIAYYNRYLSY